MGYEDIEVYGIVFLGKILRFVLEEEIESYAVLKEKQRGDAAEDI